jgi:hypothetical protein
MRPVSSKKQVNLDDCGVCSSIAIYCLVHGLDHHVISLEKFTNQARLIMSYTVMGYNFDQDDSSINRMDLSFLFPDKHDKLVQYGRSGCQCER